MSKRMPVKHIALTVICSAVLAACGGGGSSPETKLVDNAVAARKVIELIEALDTVEKIDAGDEASIKAAQKAFNNLSNDQKALVSKTSIEKLEAALKALAGLSGNSSNPDAPQTDNANPNANNNSAEIKDDKSLAPLNKPAPVHTSFISSSGAQQHNPHLQLRQVDGKPTFVDNQIGLIRNLDLKKNDTVVLDGAVLTNSAEDNPAIQVNYLTPESSITKYTSAGSTKENISPLFGKEHGIYSEVKTSLDDEIKSQYDEMKKAWEIIKDDKADPKAVAEAKKKVQEALPLYAEDFDYNDFVEIARNHQEAFTEEGMKEMVDNIDADLLNNYHSAAKIAEAWQKIRKGDEQGWETLKQFEPKFTSKLLWRVALDANSNNAIDGMEGSTPKTADVMHGIAYVHKDKNKLAFDKEFDGVYVIKFINGVRVTLHDPAAAGWTEQTFAHYVDLNNLVNHGYQSLGNETPIASVPTEGTATYRGLTTSYLTETGKPAQQLTANVVAVADFAKKGLSFKTTNPTFHVLENGVRVSTPVAGYEMSGSASWQANSNSFKGQVATKEHGFKGDLNGKFYGSQVDEIGGTYGLSNATQQLIGGYGAKRQ
ncbi:MAG: transferrin-binding protein-like solute binding protein [Neisseria zoodegmatis]|uniref:transferrin-binding protein-like solute binding protein n=1 Tax=Neisseria zoodegmatis TaxID=326523 RepID=UPI0026F27C18|nr:transferrin-binding protein-like solute binding protein [Neisseria zoodegmatis]MDO5069815.1 transferrin-binding protein-like solute binding protein [Neisseria zoodegmatis]